jgi:predicted hydrocarbon binding protein
LAEGFIEGAADHFDERVEVSQASCMLDGAPTCQIVCEFRNRA